QDEETGLYFELLEKSVHQLKSTLDEQVDQIKDTLSLKTNLEPINLNEVFHSITDSIRSLIEDSKAVFRVNFSEAGQLLANNFSLQSIFLNLISNSIKYARPGIPPEITIVSKKTAEGIQIRFTDNGIGFDMDKNKNKLFGLNQVFSQHSDSKGIGLYLVKNYMNNLGGNIEVTSQINAGSSFTLTFKN
ncbi:MAG TPA: HAMP domain-containing sensor histidine kinase, partial [Anditalea sp.]|nr:HAMP domain-containing sensor histidine kinase [Anditalea sp.]